MKKKSNSGGLFRRPSNSRKGRRIMTVKERFLNYISINTRSEEDTGQVPSTDGQLAFARMLADELDALGAEKVRISEYGYVMAELGSNLEADIPALGFIAHMDTSPDASGENIKPRIIENYDGGVIVLNEELGMCLDPAEFESLKSHIGEQLIATDGTTLLGADDKAGVAEIMCLVEHLVSHPEIKHGKICIGFTPDEEIGNGADYFDVSDFGAQFAYTVDGGELGEIEFENFNGCNAGVYFKGKSIHPGSAKNKMINASLVALEFAAMLPMAETPQHTEGYEGFYHLHDMKGGVEQAELQYIIRDHDRDKFEERKRFMALAAFYINKKYGEGTAKLIIEDRYFNMKEKIVPHRELIEYAGLAMCAAEVSPKIVPIRGGTDGARLSYMGLPCPNLCTGGHNFHGPYEYCSVNSMEKVVEILINLVEQYTKGKSE